jgi:hypothetical protein
VTTKSQLNACRDALMAGMRASTRGAIPDEQAGLVLRACLDLVEHSLGRDPASITPSEVSTTLAVLERASGELSAVPGTQAGVTAALQNAVARLRQLLQDLGTA